MSEGPVLRITGLHRTFRTESGSTVQALGGLYLQVQPGELLVLIGPTGCGKTTLLNIVAGLDRADQGELELGADLVPGHNIPCVFQHYTLFPWRTVLRNVAFGPQMKGRPRTERNDAARALLERVGLQGFEHAYPHELSGGMRQRAALAQALAIEPRMILMDEPFGALDDTTRQELQRALVELWRDTGLTILFVTHNIDEAIAVADRVAVLSTRPGRIVAEFEVDLPRPRDRVSPEFTNLFMTIRERLAQG